MPEIIVESLGGLGDGIASHDGKPVFIAKACPGDRLEVNFVHENRNGIQGVINRIIEPGPMRQTPPCFYYERCGGCSMQHLVPDYYREFKARMLHGALERAGYPMPWAQVHFIAPGSRRRVEFKASHDNNAIALAFHDLRSHTPTVIDACLLLVPQLQSLIAPLNSALSGHDFSPYLYSVALTLADSGIDMMLTFKNYDIGMLPSLDRLAKHLGIARICAGMPEGHVKILASLVPVEMMLGTHTVALPPRAFLQATKQGQDELTRIAISAVESSKSVVDLFCGIGSYSFPASGFAKVHAVELENAMVGCVQAGIKRHAISHMSAQQRDLFKQPLSARELSAYDAAIINPPRLGAKAQTQALADSGVKTVVMISCNPATFSRDAALLKAGGFALESVVGIDQFVWSPHLEIAAVFRHPSFRPRPIA